jgi:hypothetical protein
MSWPFLLPMSWPLCNLCLGQFCNLCLGIAQKRLPSSTCCIHRVHGIRPRFPRPPELILQRIFDNRNRHPRLFVSTHDHAMKKLLLIPGLVFAVNLVSLAPAKAGWWIGFPIPIPIPIPAPAYYGPAPYYGPAWVGPGYYPAGYYWGPYGYRYYGHPYWGRRVWFRGHWRYR